MEQEANARLDAIEVFVIGLARVSMTEAAATQFIASLKAAEGITSGLRPRAAAHQQATIAKLAALADELEAAFRDA